MSPKKHEQRIDNGARLLQITALLVLAFMFYLDLHSAESIDWAYYGVVGGIAAGADKRIARLLEK